MLSFTDTFRHFSEHLVWLIYPQLNAIAHSLQQWAHSSYVLDFSPTSTFHILTQCLAPSLCYHLQICLGIFRTPHLTNLLTARRQHAFTLKMDRLANGQFMPLPTVSFLLDRTAACLMKKIMGGTKVSFIHHVFMLTFHVGLMDLSPEHALSATSFRHDQLDIPSVDVLFFSCTCALNLPWADIFNSRYFWFWGLHVSGSDLWVCLHSCHCPRLVLGASC